MPSYSKECFEHEIVNVLFIVIMIIAINYNLLIDKLDWNNQKKSVYEIIIFMITTIHNEVDLWVYMQYH